MGFLVILGAFSGEIYYKSHILFFKVGTVLIANYGRLWVGSIKIAYLSYFGVEVI